ncbi:anti-sigma factor domain-containing protein [Phenylobacterium sp.]|uniref:anti-sigma factor n=1 Tax=Phenylobacterium sp. TaxID=1871053 RepID=UPI002732ADEA|nr:anti-sigma factor [Phenylobacterium sp.]MDP3855591.1 anti-sigma factor [Phenylobacterium sp.]
MSDIGPELPEDEALAAEHALGVLSVRERTIAEARMAREPAFAAQVEAWRERLAPMLAAVAPVEPPAGLWSRVERALPANDNTAGLLKRLRLWRVTAMGSMGLAAASIAAAAMLAGQPPVVIRTSPPPMAPMLDARLASTAGQPMFLAAYDPERRSMLVASLVPPGADPDHSHELWLIPTDGKPRSLGLVEPGASKAMPMKPEMVGMITEGAQLAVSVEPVGGSQQDGPSGPVAAIGKLARI